MTAADICDTLKISQDSVDYYTMNYLSGTQKTIFGVTLNVEPAGTERKVINQPLFVPDHGDGSGEGGNSGGEARRTFFRVLISSCAPRLPKK